jgi:predicted esterase YcpF (UPF0227 family)
MEFTKIYLLHGRGGSPNGSVNLLQKALEPSFHDKEFIRPLLPHNNFEEDPSKSVEFLEKLNVENGALLIGISLGGLIAAKVQELSRPDFNVICISSPTRFKSVVLEKKMSNRIVFYSSSDETISDRVKNWPELAESYDLPWLDHDTDTHIPRLVELVVQHTKEK